MTGTQTGSNRDKFERAIIDFQDRRLDEDALARAAYPTVSRIGKAVAYQLGVTDEDGDLVHQLWFFTVNKIAIEYDRSRSIYPILTTYARNLARNLLWQKRATPHLPSMLKAEGNENVEEQLADYFGPYWENGGESPQDQTDRKLILAKIEGALAKADISPRRNPARRNGLMAGVHVVPCMEIDVANPITAKPKPKGKTLSKDQKRIVEVRKALGMTQPEFADAINVEVPRLSSWEYGRTKTVPSWAMENVEAVMLAGNAKYERGMKLFDKKKMSQIVDEWRKRLHIEEGDIYSLAAIMGVSEPTIRRWYANDVRPAVQQLMDYNDLVVREARKLSTRSAARAGK